MCGKSQWLAVAIVALVVGSVQSQERPRPNVAEPNQKIPAFGGKENEERLRKLIHDTVMPPPRKPVANPPANPLLQWSQPAGGLAARIEYVSGGGYTGFTVLVRLKNVSDKPLAVPTGNPPRGGKGVPFQLYTQQVGRTLQPTIWYPEQTVSEIQRDATPRRFQEYSANAGNRFERPNVTLRPGESCLAYLCGSENSHEPHGAIKNAASIKIVLNVPVAKDKEYWTGVVETPTYPTNPPNGALAGLVAALPCPEHLPELTPQRTELANGSGNESDVELLCVSNNVLTSFLRHYEPSGVRREFEKRMLAEEKDSPMKLLLAAIASSAGSERAALFLLDSMKSTKYHDFMNVQSALEFALRSGHSDPPDWIIELVEAAITDNRDADLSNTNWSSGDGKPIKVAFFADEINRLTLTLGYTKCRKAVPFLIDLVKRTNGQRHPIMALGEMGDPRAIPVLIECLQRAGKTATYTEKSVLPDEFSRPVYALQNLKAKEAVPALLEYIEFPDVIEALETIGDPRALPAIRQLVAAKGKLVKNGVAATPFLDQKRWFAARVAEATLVGDPVPTLCEMVGDMSLDQYERRTAVWRLGHRRDPRAIPFLIRAIKSDPSGAVVNQAITVLSVFKYKAAVEGLIGCFDADFKGKEDWKRAYKPGMFQANIAESLREITGQSIGPDKAQWQAWWRDHGPASDLK